MEKTMSEERGRNVSLFFYNKFAKVVNVLYICKTNYKIMTQDELFNRFLDDDYQAKQFQIQQKTSYRERNPKQEDVIKLHKPINMVNLASKIFLK